MKKWMYEVLSYAGWFLIVQSLKDAGVPSWIMMLITGIALVVGAMIGKDRNKWL